MSDVRNYFKPTGEPLAPHELSADAAAAVQNVDVVPVKFDLDGKPTAYAYRYKLVDKSSALEKLFRHLGLYEKDNQRKVDAVSDFLSAIHDGGSRILLEPPEQS